MPSSHALWTAEEVRAATGGQWLVEPPTDWAPVRVSYEPATIMPGHLAVLRNPWTWRPDFDDDAASLTEIMRDGAVAAVLQEEQRPAAEGLSPTFPLLLVRSTRQALDDLAHAARGRFQGKVIALTGTVGKTSSREMLRCVLERQGEVVATPANNNNLGGAARTMSLAPRDADYAIIELGLGPPPGRIAHGSRLVRPHVALITTIGLAHLDTFGAEPLDEKAALRRIAEQKLAIITGAEPGATLVLNREIDLYHAIAKAVRGHVGRLISFGERRDADVRLRVLEPRPYGSRVGAEVLGQRVSFRLRVGGRGMAQNALGVLGTVAAAGADVAQAAADFGQFSAVSGRARLLLIPLPGGTATLVDDCFNAAPLSIASGLELLARVEVAPGGRRIAAFGDIHHLGPRAAELHASLAATVAGCPPDRLFTHGELMRHLHGAVPSELDPVHADTLEDLLRLIRAELRPGDALLLKASTTVGLMRVARALRKGAATL
jgi:UDP-N-acetylmuramoyl-tripeptide--D-alanyl-D-alanine ligase